MKFPKKPLVVSAAVGIVLSSAAVAYVGSLRSAQSLPAMMIVVLICQAFLSLLTNIIASPFSNQLDSWVSASQAQVEAPIATVNSGHVSKANAYRGTGKGIVIRVATVNTIAFLLINVSLAATVLYFRNLEGRHEAKFTDTGFMDMQIFLMGWLIWTLWMPAFTLVNIFIGRTARKLKFGPFGLGTAISMALYFLMTRQLGLETGLGDSQQMTSPLPGISLRTFTLLSQGVWMASIWLIMSVYALSIAGISRVSGMISNRVNRIIGSSNLRVAEVLTQKLHLLKQSP